MPAIYDLANRGLLPPGFSLVGFARRDWADQDFAADRPRLGEGSTPAPSSARRSGSSSPRASGSCPGDFDDDVAFDQLRRTIEELDQVRGTDGNHAFYLAIPPGFFGTVVGQLKEHGLADGRRRRLAPGRRREAVRPRPRVGAGAQRVARRRSSRPASIFRIDHYLGKETVQNILAMRFANDDVRADLERQLRRPRADHHGRGRRHRRPRRLLRRHRRRPRRHPEPPAPADGAGRDGGADVVRRRRACGIEKQKVLAARRAPPAARPAPPRAAQYAAGWAGGAEGAPASWRRTASRKTSTTETFAAVTLHVDTRRWAGVPFYLRTGKRLGRRVTEVAIVFKQAPHQPFSATVDRGAHPERPGDPGPARRGRDAAVRLQGARHRDGDPRRQHGLRLRRLVHRVLARRPTSG